MAVKTKKTDDAEIVRLIPINIKRFEITVRGDSSLITHKWSEKAMRVILDKQMKKASGGREARDPETEFVNTLYFITEEPEKLDYENFEAAVKNGARFGFPSTAFKQAAISGGYRSGMTKDKVSIMGAFHIDNELVCIEGKPEMRTDMVRLGGIGAPADIRFRAEFKEKEYIDRVKKAGEIIRSAKHEILGIGEKAFMTTEEAARRIESHFQDEFLRLSERLPKYVSDGIRGTIISVIHLALNHPELINDIEYAINGAMKRY
jgi:hypothetical protein